MRADSGRAVCARDESGRGVGLPEPSCPSEGMLSGPSPSAAASRCWRANALAASRLRAWAARGGAARSGEITGDHGRSRACASARRVLGRVGMEAVVVEAVLVDVEAVAVAEASEAEGACLVQVRGRSREITEGACLARHHCQQPTIASSKTSRATITGAGGRSELGSSGGEEGSGGGDGGGIDGGGSDGGGDGGGGDGGTGGSSGGVRGGEPGGGSEGTGGDGGGMEGAGGRTGAGGGVTGGGDGETSPSQRQPGHAQP